MDPFGSLFGNFGVYEYREIPSAYHTWSDAQKNSFTINRLREAIAANGTKNT